MEDLEERAIKSAEYKPEMWLRYVDDTFVIWTHGKEKLNGFLTHLNSIHHKIQFTMEIEENNKLPFLDVSIIKNRTGGLGYTVYRKPTHTDRYLHAESHHHPSQLNSVLKTLITRSERLTDNEHKTEEIEKVKKALQQNGFSDNNIKRALRPRHNRERTEEDKPVAKALLPYIKGTTDKISKVLKKHKIETVFNTDRKIGNILPSAKTKIPLEGQGVYQIPCGDCEKSYIGQTNRRVQTRREEHRNAVEKNQATSSLAQHAKNTGHKINFEETRIIANIEHKTKRIIREAIEIEKHTKNLNTRDDTQRLPIAWKPILANKIIRARRNASPSMTSDAPTSSEPRRKPVKENAKIIYKAAAEQAQSSPTEADAVNGDIKDDALRELPKFTDLSKVSAIASKNH
ncbi:uncharacterized protein LOC111691923 [Anoplophora glabripennis]|uniref:uncharacterized protein LOC111691923 n=1 Tax=Anoplophora glabripennis TaxID=217634 RepID=UPI000C78D372|nr:uncharacterized protein LOC111691923 [Anoplophora glabripennis]